MPKSKNITRGKVVTMPVKPKLAPIPDSPKEQTIDELNELLRENPLNDKAYSRLMILYRKEKAYKKELHVIDTGIKAFEAIYNKSKNTDSKISKVSRQINMAFGLTDKKGQSTFDHEPVATWKKRRLTVLNKLESKPKKK